MKHTNCLAPNIILDAPSARALCCPHSRQDMLLPTA
ncbi:MAG: hypothetical protein JWQ73_4223, partial [Variovorax sp.]|nr:hypothetical protein [Variovorax sp.]